MAAQVAFEVGFIAAFVALKGLFLAALVLLVVVPRLDVFVRFRAVFASEPWFLYKTIPINPNQSIESKQHLRMHSVKALWTVSGQFRAVLAKRGHFLHARLGDFLVQLLLVAAAAIFPACFRGARNSGQNVALHGFEFARNFS